MIGPDLPTPEALEGERRGHAAERKAYQAAARDQLLALEGRLDELTRERDALRAERNQLALDLADAWGIKQSTPGLE